MGRRILIVASLIIGVSIVHANPVELDWMGDRFFTGATGSLSGTFGIYQVAVLPVFPTPTDINYKTVILPEPDTLAIANHRPYGDWYLSPRFQNPGFIFIRYFGERNRI